MECNLCDVSIRCLFSPGKGEGMRNSVMVVTSSITESQYKKGITTGKSIKVFIKKLKESGFKYYITPLVKCPTYEPTAFEIDNCLPKLKKEIYEISPKVIITIGDVVTSKFLKYTYFKKVVNKASVNNINGKDVIIYPVYSEKNKDIDVMKSYDTAFKDLEKIYRAFVDNTYISFKLINYG